ncbi:MAG: hypothetical protein QM831_46295 [Kofleriaceae bacterium]
MVAFEETSCVFETLARRTRLARRHAFVDAGLWPADKDHARVCCEQIVRGHDLRRTLLIPALGDELHSAQLFYLLADAHELGAATARWIGADEQPAGRMCAAVAVAGALVDRVYARSEDYANELASVIDESKVAALLDGERIDLVLPTTPDVRIAIRAIQWAITELRAHVRVASTNALGLSLIQLLRTERRIFSAQGGSEWLYVELARARFELVFAVFREIVTACSFADPRLDQVFGALGRAIARNRDLAELCDDVRGGRLNALAAIAGATPTRTPNSAKVRMVGQRLTKLDLVESFAKELKLEAETLAHYAMPARLTELFASYARRTFE